MKPERHGTRWRIRWFEGGVKKSASYDSQEEAQAALDARKGPRLVSAPQAPTEAPKTFGEVCDWWITTMVPQKASGADDRSRIENHLRPYFGAMALDDIQASHVEEFKIAWLKRTKGEGKATLHRCTSLFGTLMKRAREDLEWTTKIVKVRHPKYQDAEFSYLETKQEIRALLVAARSFKLRTNKRARMLETLYATAIYTGMRLGELCGLDWAQVNMQGRRIDVIQQYNAKPLKGKQRRTVPIVNALKPYLDLWKVECPHATYVFPNERGGRLIRTAKSFDEHFVWCLKKAHLEFRELSFHDLRHTYASHYMANGGSLFTLQHYLGHESVKTTQRYAHFSPTQYLDDLDRF